MGWNGSTFEAKTPEELAYMLQMATGGGGAAYSQNPNPTLGLDSPVVAAASAFLPGGLGGDIGVTGPVSYAEGPAKTAAGRVGSKVTSGGNKILTQLNNLRKGYEAGVTPLVNNQTAALTGLIKQGPVQAGRPAIGRFAGAALRNPLMQAGMKYAPLIGTGLAVGDVILGDESLANKGMDTAAMAVGGFLGSAVPVVGTGLGIAAGKMVSDGTQWLFGDKKTPEQRKMELALAQLQGGGMV
jgi:hypothetical protein